MSDRPGFAGFVAAVQAANPDTAVCLTGDYGGAQKIKQAFGGCRRLPPVVPLPTLLRVMAAMPALSTAQAIALCAWADVSAIADSNRRHLCWYLYDLLSAYIPYSARARFGLAQRLSVLFIALDRAQVVDGNPFDVGEDEAVSYEWRVAQAVWQTAAQDDPDVLLLHNRLVQKMPVMTECFALTDARTPPLHRALLTRCGARVWEEPTPPAASVGAMANASASAADDDGDDAATLTEAWQAGGDTLTESAQSALTAIRLFLAEDNKRRIGVVVYDRALARRLRALAESERVFIKDTVGWRLETLSVGMALSVFARAVLGDFDGALMTQCLNKPFFADSEQRAAARKQWAAMLQNETVLPVTLAELSVQATQMPVQKNKTAMELHEIIAPLITAQKNAPQRATPMLWCAWLVRFSAPMLAAWRDDVLAQSLFRLLQQTAERCELNAEEFLLWLESYLSEEVMSLDDNVDSAVEFVSPSTQRQFDALVLLGFADSGDAYPPQWLAEEECEKLGLLTMRQQFEERWRHFAQLSEKHTRIAAVWQQRGADGEAVPAHRFWQLLTRRIDAAGRLKSLPLPTVAVAAKSDSDAEADAKVINRGAQFYLSRWPARMNMSASRDLMKCPYHFYNGQILKLRDEEDGDAESVMLIGSVLHKKLDAFVTAAGDCDDESALEDYWRAVLDFDSNRPLLALHRRYWLAHAAAVAKWQQQRGRDGWRVRGTEQTLNAEWQGKAQTVELRGQIDRLDCNAAGEWEVMDYKSGSLPPKKFLNAGGDLQIFLYAYYYERLFGFPVAQAALVRPVGAAIKPVQLDWTDEQREAVTVGFLQPLQDMDEGKAVVANGIDCAECTSAGICRKAHWH